MDGPDKPPVEADRLQAVWHYRALHRGPDTALDRISRLAARIFDVPMAAVSFVDEDTVSYIGRFGLDIAETTAEPGLCATAVRRHGTYVLGDADADPRAANHPMVQSAPWVRFYAAVPLVVAEGFHVGTLAVFDTEPRQASSAQLAMLHDLAQLAVDQMELRQAAVSVIEVEQEARSRMLAETERVGNIAKTLHTSLMPAHLPDVPGLDLAAHYQPFAKDGLGGDFFDVFPIDGKRWGIFVGDVVGKGVEAAAFTSLARYSLRASALVESGPAQVLSDVNDVILLDPAGSDSLYCTIAYGEFTPIDDGRWRVEIAIGGHPPPLVLRQSSIEAVQAGGTIVGSFDDQRFAAATVELEPGDTIVMYSDGMTDMRSGHGWLGIDGVTEAFGGREIHTAEAAVTILREVISRSDEPLRDDLVIVAATVPIPASEGTRDE